MPAFVDDLRPAAALGAKGFAVNHLTVWDAFPILSFVRTDFVRMPVEEQVWFFFWPRLIFTLAKQIALYRGAKSAGSSLPRPGA
jgi:hypothetical protein